MSSSGKTQDPVRYAEPQAHKHTDSESTFEQDP